MAASAPRRFGSSLTDATLAKRSGIAFVWKGDCARVPKKCEVRHFVASLARSKAYPSHVVIPDKPAKRARSGIRVVLRWAVKLDSGLRGRNPEWRLPTCL